MTVQNDINGSAARGLIHYQRRLYDAETKQYVHQSGEGMTSDRNYSWVGTKAQAHNLARKAKAEGQGWPGRVKLVRVNHGEVKR